MGCRMTEDERIVRVIRNRPLNRKCINCNLWGPQFVCTTYSTFVCATCGDIHRRLTHRVKWISMDKFTPQEIASLRAGGNERAREIFFKEWDPQRHSAPFTRDVCRLREFIKHVYVDRKYAGERTIDKSPRITSSSSLASNVSNTTGLKRETPFIDFDVQPEPPTAGAAPTQLSITSQPVTQSASASSDDNIAENNVSQAPPNSNSLESARTQLSDPSPALVSRANASTPSNVNAGASPSEAAQFPSMASFDAALPHTAAPRGSVHAHNLGLVSSWMPPQSSSSSLTVPPLALSFGSPIPGGIYMGHQQPTNMKPLRLPYETESHKVGGQTSIIVPWRCLPPNMECYKLLAIIALSDFNSTEGTNFTFVKLVKKCVYRCGLRSYLHVNFIATVHGHGGDSGGDDDDGYPPEIFFAEVYSELICNEDESEEDESEEDESEEDESEDEACYIQVKGCALLQNVDTPNPLGQRCNKCANLCVIHPGPRSGYRVVAGDKFESSVFMGYNPCKVRESLQYELPWGRNKIKHTSDRLEMFKSCANRALLHFNCKEKSKFYLAKVLLGFSMFISFGRIAHLNFLAEWPEKFKEPVLFFAEVVVPMLYSQRLCDWDPSVEDLIKVKGCCQLTKSDFGSVFGRVCELCITGIIHPGPRDGYDIVAGDCFEGYQFIESGNGIY